MKNIKILLYLLSIILLNAACSEEESQLYEPQLNIYSFLQGGRFYSEVFVDRSYLMDEPSSHYVDDALVLLDGGGPQDTLVFIDSLYKSYDKFIYPESTYTLTVIHPDYDTVFGTTRIPGNFQIIFPEPGDTFKISDTILITKSTGAPYYYGYFTNDVYNIPFWHTPDTSDTVIRIPMPIQIQNLPAGYYVLQLMACDENYFEYSRFDPLQDSLLQSGIEGGIGVFASFNLKTTSIYLSH